MRQLLLAIVVAGCNSEQLTSSGAVARTSSPKADVSALAPVHSVTGSGHTVPGQGLEFATNLAIHQDATGRVWASA